MTIKWGDPIECNGVRPDWLRGDDLLQWTRTLSDSTYWTETRSRGLNFAYGEPWQISHIRLPADHPAYVALAKGFTPWRGGENAPDDWDGGAVLLNGKSECPGALVTDWRACEDFGNAKIIGYRKRRMTNTVEVRRMTNTVEVRRMTEAEAEDRLLDMPTLRELGILRDETDAERFTRETGHEVTEPVEAALAWRASQ